MPADRQGEDPARLPTLNLTGGRRIKTVRACWFEGDEARFVSLMPSTGRIRKELDSLKGGETVEFIGRPCEWHDMSGQNYYIVIVIDIVILPKRQNA